MKSRLYLLVFSLLLNALGNAVAITTNLGANPHGLLLVKD